MNVRILHHHEPPYGWWFDSPDVPGLSGSADTLAVARGEAESVVRWHLTCEAEEAGLPAPDIAAVEFEHFVNDPAAAVPAAA
ncbi:unannotated protein [freshwater metagenome]|uniref:Unannotated protein n=1 Tax=freshwater metagenome TaxID=449393 RepID=A0A6J7FAC4_9ZZZZ|nr:hypothetical protein [Actinomycetota bacterium]